MVRNKQILHGLDQNKYEHPFDHEALDRLEALPFLTKATKWITENTIEKIYTVQFTGSHLKVTRDNYPKIYEYLEYACEILDGMNKFVKFISIANDSHPWTVMRASELLKWSTNA